MKTMNRVASPGRQTSRLPDVSRFGLRPSSFENSELTADSIVEQLSPRILPLPSGSRKRVLRAYDRAAVRLEQARTDVEKFNQTIICQSMDFVDFPEQLIWETIKRMSNLLGDVYDFRFSRPRSVKTLGLLSSPPSEVHAALSEHLSNSLHQFGREVMELFDAMAQRQIAGHINYGGDACEFTYFRSKALILSKSARKRKKRRRQRSEGNKVITTEEFQHCGHVQVRHVFAQHLISSAETIPVHRWSLPLPQRIKPIVTEMPRFLRPFASVVHGYLEHARFVEKDIARLPYEYVSEHVTVEEFRHYDPCITLGPWVIAGWCPLEQPRAWMSRRCAATLVHRFVARDSESLQ